MRSVYKVLCDCGHEGSIILKENDTPYSNNHWESYSLKNLNGSPGNRPEGNADWATLFRSMGITCPMCNKSLSEKNMKWD